MVRKRYLSIVIALLLLAFPANAGAAPLFELPDTGSLASPEESEGYVAVDPTSGTLIATSGFDVMRDGFSFENWGKSDSVHRRSMTPATMQSLYGDRICARIVDGACILTATGELLERDSNESSDGGHCFGLAVVAGLFATGKLDKADYLPAGQNVYDAAPSDELDGLISRYFNTQHSAPTADASSESSVAVTLDQMQAAWARGDNYVLGVLGEIGGHAITPIALRDLGSGKTGIVVYDNNYPGEEKMVVTDPAANTWYYTTALNPADTSYLFVGSPENQMILFELPQTTEIHECPTCRDTGDDSVLVLVKDNAENPDGTEIDWTPTVTTPDGRPVAGLEMLDHMNTRQSLLFSVPADVAFKLTLGDVPIGPAPDVDISVFGNGWINEIDEISLLPGSTTSVSIDRNQSTISLTSNVPVNPKVMVSSEQATSSVAVTGTGLQLLPGSTLTVDRQSDGDYAFALNGVGLPRSMQLGVRRIDTVADYSVTTRGPVSIPVNSSASLAAETWNGTAPLTVRVDGNGTNQTYPMVPTG